MKKPARNAPASPEKQLATFLAKFEPGMARHIRACRAALRKLLPTAFALVYDNYNFFVIGYGPTERPSEGILSIAANARGVGLAFLHGATLPDPDRLLLGSGKFNRFIRIPTLATLRSPVPFPTDSRGRLVIRSISAKQLPRRKTIAKS